MKGDERIPGAFTVALTPALAVWVIDAADFLAEIRDIALRDEHDTLAGNCVALLAHLAELNPDAQSRGVRDSP